MPGREPNRPSLAPWAPEHPREPSTWDFRIPRRDLRLCPAPRRPVIVGEQGPACRAETLGKQQTDIEKESPLRRKTLDMILTAGGAVLIVVLLAAGGLGLWGYSFANSNVHDQLAQQQITFPPAAAFAHRQGGHRDHAQHDPVGVAVRRDSRSSPVSRPRSTPTTSSPCTSRRSAGARPTPS